MISLEQIKEISIVSDSKIVMLVLDGLGGLPDIETGKTELEKASTPNFDYLAKNGICGLSIPVSHGITPGSGAGHLALFGYDPLQFTIGRGILEAMGIGFDIAENDIAARGNFCGVDSHGIITDRRAGRITTDKCAELCNILGKIRLEDAEVFIQPVKEHRFLFVLRGTGMSPEISDTDPLKTGLTPIKSTAKKEAAKKTAKLVNEFVDKAAKSLAEHHPANMILLRGFSKKPSIPSIKEIYKLLPAAIAAYPMYRGLASLIGMDVFKAADGIKEEIAILHECYHNHDFFFLHVKQTDSAGEDGDFRRKVQVIEEVDSFLPQLIDLKPDVILVTGDHSTPAVLKGHSWHPVPFLLYSKWCRPDRVMEFSESACASGSLGTFPAVDIMRLAMANALKLSKFGA